MNLDPNATTGQWETPTCPNSGETYRPQDKLGFRGDVTERHPVSTHQKVKLRNGVPVLVLKATCPCGFSETNVIGAEEADE